VGVVLENRRSLTAARVETLKASLQDSKRIAEGKACVYATGSFARGEASTVIWTYSLWAGPRKSRTPIARVGTSRRSASSRTTS